VRGCVLDVRVASAAGGMFTKDLIAPFVLTRSQVWRGDTSLIRSGTAPATGRNRPVRGPILILRETRARRMITPIPLHHFLDATLSLVRLVTVIGSHSSSLRAMPSNTT
jgi:hypothetical protein